VDGLQKNDQDKYSSDQTWLGPLDKTDSRFQNVAEEQFLAMLCFEQRGKLAKLTDSSVEV
jgi:hypothetical protein